MTPIETDDLTLRGLLAAKAGLQLAVESSPDPIAKSRYLSMALDQQREILRRIGVVTREQMGMVQS